MLRTLFGELAPRRVSPPDPQTTSPAALHDSGHGGTALRERRTSARSGRDVATDVVVDASPAAAMRAHFVSLGVPDSRIYQEAFISPQRTNEGDAGADASPPDGRESDGSELAAGRQVTFQRAGKAVRLSRGLTVLEAAEAADVTIPYECRSGICGQCKTRLVSGRIVMETRDALTRAEEARGIFLPCQAHATEDLVVDA